MGFCMDCDHARLLPHGGPRLCREPSVRALEPVSGWVECAQARCDMTRYGTSPCGVLGSLFVQRAPDPPRRPWWKRWRAG